MTSCASFISDFLRGFCFPTDLLFNLPVGEKVLMSATRALPRTFDRIGATLMEHLHNQVAMKTHRGMAQNQLPLYRLRRNCHIQPPIKLRASSFGLQRRQFANYELITACKTDVEKGGLGRLSRGFSKSPWGIIGKTSKLASLKWRKFAERSRNCLSYVLHRFLADWQLPRIKCSDQPCSNISPAHAITDHSSHCRSSIVGRCLVSGSMPSRSGNAL